jgi:hypothetical protein
MLRTVHPSFPSIIFGATAVAACLVATLLPETKGVVMVRGGFVQGAAFNPRAYKVKNN